jgi:alpha-beta hydrolase superfamily lysophospholipase
LTLTAIALLAIPFLLIALLAAMIIFGTAKPPKPMESMSAPFAQIDFRDLPSIETFSARDGSALAYRAYPAGDRIAILIHGSAGGGAGMHALAKALQATGISAYAPDIRGHGASGPDGDIAYAGQIDDDLADFLTLVRSKHPAGHIALAGFSSGGGYVLRVAGGPNGGLFDNYLLISPYLGHRAPTQRPHCGGWAAPYIPRMIALLILDRLGFHRLEGLPVIAFAIEPGNEKGLTSTSSYRIARTFHPNADYLKDFRKTPKPMTVVAGAADEVFYAEKYAPLIHAVRPDIPVTLVPGLGHIDMILKPQGIKAVAAALSAAPPPG